MKKLTPLLAVSIIILLIIRLSKASAKTSINLISPLLSQQKILGINQWFPSSGLGVQTDAPQISSKGAIFIDTKRGEILYSKNIHQRLPIASLVKVMTVLIALEHKNLEDQFTVSKEAAEMEPDKMLLIEGEKLTLKELLDGIFLISANDAAEVLAEGTTGNREEFIKLMNDRAKQLGIADTFFANPTGLDEDENNSYSTPYDLAILTRFLIRRFPEVVNISKTEHIFLPQTDTHQDYDMYSGINLLTTYPGVVGFKTGFTPEAGLTLITLARENGHEIVGVLLGSGDRRDEARDLLDYSFRKLSI
ncbi:D-alanyl-D-alanine carboxypeptidase [Candidatus Daviesbacteria bacterium]|nr:D-alanyl-D-alanine carboxypeptidase [Candidatus Daviesbacteria bacterium]